MKAKDILLQSSTPNGEGHDNDNNHDILSTITSIAQKIDSVFTLANTPRNGRLEKFLDGVVEGKAVKVAYRDAGYSQTSLHNAYDILHRPCVVDILAAKHEEARALKNWIVKSYVAQLAKDMLDNPSPNDPVKLKAIPLVIKLLGNEGARTL